MAHSENISFCYAEDGTISVKTDGRDFLKISKDHRLIEVTLHHVTQLPKFAFYGYSKLRTANLPNCLEEIGEGALLCPIKNLKIPASVKKIDEIACHCQPLEEIEFLSNNNQAGELIIEKSAFGTNKLKRIIFSSNPNKSIIIGPNAFSHNDCYIEEISLGEGITEIREYAFANMTPSFSKMNSGEKVIITLPKSLKKIGTNALPKSDDYFLIYYHPGQKDMLCQLGYKNIMPINQEVNNTLLRVLLKRYR